MNMFSQAYRTIKGDKDRYNDRLEEIASRPNKSAPDQPETYLSTESPGNPFLSALM